MRYLFGDGKTVPAANVPETEEGQDTPLPGEENDEFEEDDDDEDDDVDDSDDNDEEE